MWNYVDLASELRMAGKKDIVKENQKVKAPSDLVCRCWLTLQFGRKKKKLKDMSVKTCNSERTEIQHRNNT